jgi:chromosome segregation ATPase
MAKAEGRARTQDVAPAEAARVDLEQAQQAHAREAQRLEEAQREIERLGDELREADPDKSRFAQLASERDAARARASALAERVEAARATLERVREAHAATEREQRKVRLAALDAQLREADAALTREVVEFYRALLGRIGEVRKLAAEANQLGPAADPARGSRWAQASPNRGAWRWAAGILPEDGAEVQS